jgi:23S rRNA (guanosine2251-2'-O)-methyltransferase
MIYQVIIQETMEESSFYIYGRNAIMEAIAAAKEIEKIFIRFGAEGTTVTSVIIKAKRMGIPSVRLDSRKFADLVGRIDARDEQTQGIIALLRSFKLVSLGNMIESAFVREPKPMLVLLDGICDPHNLGAIARSVECSGGSGIILSERDSAPISPVAIKSSAGALEHLSVAKVSSVAQTIDKLKDEGFWVIGAEADGEKLYTDDVWNQPTLLVIGSEGKGLKPASRKHCDFLVRIPLRGNVNSLNSSVAAAVLLFESMRQKSVKVQSL